MQLHPGTGATLLLGHGSWAVSSSLALAASGRMSSSQVYVGGLVDWEQRSSEVRGGERNNMCWQKYIKGGFPCSWQFRGGAYYHTRNAWSSRCRSIGKNMTATPGMHNHKGAAR